MISGTHTAVLAAFLMLLLRLCFVRREIRPVRHLGAALALRAGHRLGIALRALRRRIHSLCHRRYFARERRVLNILAAVAIAFLVLDPEQMFEASFQLTFLAVAFIGAFAAPLLERTSYPRGARAGGSAGYRPRPAPAARAAQFRVEMRLLAETLRVWTRLPERASCLAIPSGPRAALRLPTRGGLGHGADRAGAADGGLLPPHRIFGRLRQRHRRAADVRRRSRWASWLSSPAGRGWRRRPDGCWLLSHAAVDWHMRCEPNWRIPDAAVVAGNRHWRRR